MSSHSISSALPLGPVKRPRTGGFWAGIASTFLSIREGVELASEYKDLTDRGMASDVAARKVFDKIGRA